MNRHELMAQSQRPVGEEVLLGASCHNPLELAKAMELGVDYILLSPVLPTHSHPDAAPLGWQIFTDWVSSVNIPVYALGGMNSDHLVQAKLCGGQGIASIGAWWPD
jgi:8-oxo-dGTP diphosphatase